MSEANKDLVRRHFEEIWNQRQLDENRGDGPATGRPPKRNMTV